MCPNLSYCTFIIIVKDDFMTKNLIITIDKDANNIVANSKTNINNVYFPIDNYVYEDADSSTIFDENDVWSGMGIFETTKKLFSKLTKDYSEIIVVICNFSIISQGFIYCFAKFLSRRRKKLILITNCNSTSKFFLSAIKAYCKIIDVYSDNEYQDFYQKYFPKISILELYGLLNTIYLREIKKYA